MGASTITINGNVASDPQLTTMPGGNSKLFFSLASDYRYQKDGEWVSKPNFIPVVAWRSLADQAASLLQKGSWVTVVGRIDSYQKEPGEPTQHSIIAESISLDVRGLESATRRSGGAGGTRPLATSAASPTADPW